ncbi:hypothetical protein D3C79_827180 [compost metagenome]
MPWSVTSNCRPLPARAFCMACTALMRPAIAGACLPCTSAGSRETMRPLWLAMALRLLARLAAGRLNDSSCSWAAAPVARLAMATATGRAWDQGLSTEYS